MVTLKARFFPTYLIYTKAIQNTCKRLVIVLCGLKTATSYKFAMAYSLSQNIEYTMSPKTNVSNYMKYFTKTVNSTGLHNIKYIFLFSLVFTNLLFNVLMFFNVLMSKYHILTVFCKFHHTSLTSFWWEVVDKTCFGVDNCVTFLNRFFQHINFFWVLTLQESP